MGRKKRNRAYGLTPTESCEESIPNVKARLKRARKNLKTILRMCREDIFEYDMRNEVVGKAYLNVTYIENELERRKARV